MKKLKVEVTEAEWELINAIRNYKRSYPNGYPNLLYFAQERFDELIDSDLD